MLQLFLELPNPGGRGRRIVALAGGSARPHDIHTHARTGSEGPDFLAVEWPTIQRLESQAVRDDADRVMLVGVDTARVPPAQQDRVRDALRELRPEIARILTSIDWTTVGQQTVIESAALAELLQRPVFKDLPTRAEASQPRRTDATTTVRPPTGNTPRAIALVGSAIVLVALTIWWWNTPDGRHPPPPEPDKRLKQAAAAMECSDQELQTWINTAQGKPAKLPLDNRTLDRLSKPNGVGRFFVSDPPVDEDSQLRKFITALSPETATESTRLRVALAKAHAHLVSLRESAGAVRDCADWRRRLQSTDDPDRPPLPDNHVTFIASLVTFGTEQLTSLVAEPEVADPVFRENDDRRFKNLAKFFIPERQDPIKKVTDRITYTGGNSSEALLEVTGKMPLNGSEREDLRAIGEKAAFRAKCPDIDELVKHYVAMCVELGEMRRAVKEP